MAVIRVNPTRMELTRLKKRLRVARRGHKLLKDKRDELMKKFLDIVRKNKELRLKAEAGMSEVHQGFLAAGAVMSASLLEEALMLPKFKMNIEVATRNIMSVDVPVLSYSSELTDSDELLPYGYAFTSGELDASVSTLTKLLPLLLALAESEKTARLLADEIEKTRRRVNALEYVLIPQLTETIRYISMKLEENERGSLSRLMKVKDMMIKQVLEASRQNEPEYGKDF